MRYLISHKIAWCIALAILLFPAKQSVFAGDKKSKEPISYSLLKFVLKPIIDDIGKAIADDIEASFTSGEREFYRQITEDDPDLFKTLGKDDTTHLDYRFKEFCEWIANGRGEVDISFPVLIQIVSVTKFDRPKLLIQHAGVSPAKQGGNHAFVYTRSDCKDGIERMVITGMFRIKRKQGESMLARSVRSFEFHKGKWVSTKEEFEWIQNLP